MTGSPATVVLEERKLDAQLEWLRGTRVPLASVTARGTNSDQEQQFCCLAIDLLMAGSALQARHAWSLWRHVARTCVCVLTMERRVRFSW